MKAMPGALRCAAASLLFVLFVLVGCGGGGDDGGSTGTPPAGTVVGPAGGTVPGPNGATLVIPPGALATETSIAIEQTSAGSPALPGSFNAAGAMFALTPHGTSFAVPVTLTLPFDPATIAAGGTPTLFKTDAAGQWELVSGATFGNSSVSAQITSFSWVLVNGLLRNDPTREWRFGLFPANGGNEIRLDGDTLVGGVLDELAAFGPGNFDEPVVRFNETLPPDKVANGLIFSTASGVTYGVSAEAPDGKVGGPDPIGSASRLTQRQSFVKVSDDATLSFTLTSVIVELRDFNFAMDPALAVTAMKGEATLAVSAVKSGTTDPFFYTAGRAGIYGARGFFIPRAEDESFSRSHLWSRVEDFDFVTEAVTYPIGVGPTVAFCDGTRVALTLKRPITYTIDLSSVNRFEEFTLRSDAFAETLNTRGGGAEADCSASSIRVFLRDPIEIGGTALAFTGLAPTNRPEVTPEPGPVLVAPAACVPGPGPDPEAGVLQFDAASYTVDEAAAAPTITVTRTGGSRGAVSATFSTSDGSAIAGSDYVPVTGTVFFADGDAAPRVVSVLAVRDEVDEVDKTVNLTLSQPGGCAALGTRTTAVLTVRDDDLRPAVPSGLDTSFGIGGKATTTAFGGDRSGMAVQADGKIVMVGGTFTDFVLARFNADGSLDTGFGVEGKVRTDMGSGLRQEEALAVAIQGDGKIVVVGHTAIPTTPPAPILPPTFALARYNADGSLDTSFGTGGRVSGNVNGQAHAVAIQGDGKIVVAGEFSFASTNGNDFGDVTIARFNPNGTLDASFGASGTGQIVTDIGLSTNAARNVVVQPNGAIVVSGKPQGSQAGFDHTDVVRYLANGSLDTSFGNGGKLTLAGVDVGQGLARQADGKFVLVGVTGDTVPATARFLLRRLNADGSPDTSFGTAGTVDTAFTESASASGVALQGDGKIVVVGSRAFSANANFVVARYHPDGAVDRGFGSDGNLQIDFFGFSDVGENVVVQPDGRIVVGGLARNNVDGYGVARINP